MTEQYQEQRGQRAGNNTFYLIAFGRQLYSNGDSCLAVTAWRFGSPVLSVLTTKDVPAEKILLSTAMAGGDYKEPSLQT